MTTSGNIYQSVRLEKIRNKNEKRVVRAMEAVLPNISGFCGCSICVADVYAATLNSLPAHYVQHGGIALRAAPEKDEDVQTAVHEAASMVVDQPNHG